MPAPRPLAHSRRLLAHGVGLGLLAGGVVLGAQGAAHALQYVFTGTVDDPGLQLSFENPRGFQSGTGQVTGSFFLNQDNTLSDVNVRWDSFSGNTVDDITFSTGYYDAASNRLVFGTENTLLSCPSSITNVTGGGGFGVTPSPCLDLQLAGDGLDTPSAGEVVSFPPDDDALGDFFAAGNSGTSAGLLGDGRIRNLEFVSGTLRQIPAPLSALALLPLTGLKRYRRRFQRLCQARESSISVAGLG